MENKAPTKTTIPIHRESISCLVSRVSCLLSSVFCLPPYPPILPSLPRIHESIMQNKANVKMGNINISTARTKAYANEQRTMSNDHYPKQTQSNPIPPPPTRFFAQKSSFARPWAQSKGKLPAPIPIFRPKITAPRAYPPAEMPPPERSQSP